MHKIREILCYCKNILFEILNIIQCTFSLVNFFPTFLFLFFPHRFFLQHPANPDLLYIIFFCHSQLTITILLCLIFASKVRPMFSLHEERKYNLGSISLKSENFESTTWVIFYLKVGQKVYIFTEYKEFLIYYRQFLCNSHFKMQHSSKL